MTRMATQEERWDRERDYRKHDDGFPARFERKLSTAMDLVVLVKAMPNCEDAAALVERFIKDKADEQRLDAVAAGARP